METIKRQTRVAYSWLVIDQSCLAYDYDYELCARSVCDMSSAAAAAVCGLWLYTSVIIMHLPLQV